MEIPEVLILVLMEDTHWGISILPTALQEQVLILVLMEDTHWAILPTALQEQGSSS